MAALVDTNILVYRFDRRFPEKQRIATELLRKGIADDSIRVPHQAVGEFVSVVTRPIDRGRPLLPLDTAFREADLTRLGEYVDRVLLDPAARCGGSERTRPTFRRKTRAS